jgi:GNAT superfamily N-acetyltransferase
MAVEVRAAQRDEAPALLRMYEGLFEPPGARPPSWDPARAERALIRAIDDERATVLVAERQGEAVGLCAAYLDLESVRYGLRCWVEDLVVERESRSRGAGGALLDAAAAWARERGATHLELDTGLARTDAQRFYERREPATVGYSYSWVL